MGLLAERRWHRAAQGGIEELRMGMGECEVVDWLWSETWIIIMLVY